MSPLCLLRVIGADWQYGKSAAGRFSLLQAEHCGRIARPSDTAQSDTVIIVKRLFFCGDSSCARRVDVNYSD